MVHPQPSIQVGLNVIKTSITTMCEGDIQSFIDCGRLMDNVDFVELSGHLEEASFFALFTGRSFIDHVASNLSADSMFGFPPEGSELRGIFHDIALNTGKFFYELIIESAPDYSVSMKYFSNAVSNYYKYLRILDSRGKISDLDEEESIWQHYVPEGENKR
jgi:hypothetical protein